MKKWHIILASFVVWMAILATLIIVNPVKAQSTVLPQARYDASESKYVIANENAKLSFTDLKDVIIPFNVTTGSPSGFNTTADFQMRVIMSCNDQNKSVRVKYTFFNNGVEVDEIREDFVGLSGTTIVGSYPPTVIRSDAIQAGDNTLTIKVSVSSEVAKSETPCSFYLEMSDVHLNVTAVDADNDGISDPVDPIIGMNNYAALPLLGTLAIPVSTIVVRMMPKKSLK
jgi:hypothetical protein